MVRRATSRNRWALSPRTRPRALAADWFSNEELARSDARHRGLGRLRCWRAVLDVAVPLVFGLAGFSALTTRLNPGAVWTDRALAMMLVLELARVPHRLLIDGWVEVVRPRRQGSAPSAGLFVVSFVGLAMVRLVIGSGLLLAGLAIVAATPWWPVVLWLASVAAMVVAGYGYPLLVAPLLDRAVLLTDPTVGTDLAQLAQRAGLALPRVLVATNPSLGEGAYVAGMGRTRSLVLGAELVLGSSSLRDAVVAHELGHWKLRHQRVSLACWAASAAVLLGTAWLAGNAGAARVVGASDLADPRAVPVWLVVGGVVGLGGRVGMAAQSRAQERQADEFALRLLGERSGLAEHLRHHLLATDGELDPTGWWRLVATHPAPADRLALLGAGTAMRAQGHGHRERARTMVS